MQGMQKNDLVGVVERFKGKRIWVLGDVMLDEYWIGGVHRISPEAPVPVVNIEEKEFKLGGAANLAHNLKKLGAEVILYGITADDEAEKRLEILAKEQSIDFRHWTDEQKKFTTRKVRTVSTRNESYQQLLRSDFEDKKHNPKAFEDAILEMLAKEKNTIDIIMLSDYGKGFFSEDLTAKIIETANASGIKVASAPKPSGSNHHVMEAFKKSYLVMCNQDEAQKLSHLQYDATQAQAISKSIQKKLEAKYVLITHGPKGISIYGKNKYDLIEPPIQRSVFDVTGAGDTAFAAAGLSISTGSTIQQAAILANYAAGLVITKSMTSTISNQELIEIISSHTSYR